MRWWKIYRKVSRMQGALIICHGRKTSRKVDRWQRDTLYSCSNVYSIKWFYFIEYTIGLFCNKKFVRNHFLKSFAIIKLKRALFTRLSSYYINDVVRHFTPYTHNKTQIPQLVSPVTQWRNTYNYAPLHKSSIIATHGRWKGTIIIHHVTGRHLPKEGSMPLFRFNNK